MIYQSMHVYVYTRFAFPTLGVAIRIIDKHDLFVVVSFCLFVCLLVFWGFCFCFCFLLGFFGVN